MKLLLSNLEILPLCLEDNLLEMDNSLELQEDLANAKCGVFLIANKKQDFTDI